MRLLDTLEAVRDTLEAAAIRVAFDQASLNPPAVLLGPPSLRFDRLCDDAYGADIPLWIVVPNAGTVASYDALSSLLELVHAIYHGPTAEPVDLSPLDGGDPLPAYRMTISLDWTD